MIIFLSYASEQRDIAEQTELAIAASGHKVFLDRHSLPVGDEYHLRIRKAVEESDVFVFLISPQSVVQGCYALTELKYAREKWPDPRGKVLPVMVERTDYRHIPPYLKSISVLEPEGNTPAEIVAEIQKWSTNDIQDVVKLGGNTLKTNAVRFIAVLAGPRNFIKSIDHKSDHALIDASVFAVFISVVNLIISLPAYRLANIKADTLTYVLIDTVITFVFWFLYGSIYHLSARLVGGRGKYQSSIVAVLYLTAFTVISGIFTLPLTLATISWSLESSDVPALSEWQILGNQIVKHPTGLTCTLLISATILYRWICTIGVFMIIHEVSRAKAIFICLLAACLSWVILLTVEKPAIALFWRAFS